jgi:hypothetical protein
MGASSFYAGFDIVRRDADGVIIPLAFATVTLSDGGDGFAPVSSGEGGRLNDAETEVVPGSVIEFSIDGYPNIFTRVTQETADLAILNGKESTFIAEDLYETKEEAVSVDIYVQDLDAAGSEPRYLASGEPGTTIVAPYPTNVSKNVRVFLVSREEKGRATDYDFADAEQQDFAISPPPIAIADPLSGATPNRFLVVGTGPAIAETPTVGPLQSARRNAANNAWEVFTPGTVSSVGLSVPSILSVSGSPVTASGTLAVSLANQTGNTVFASPSGGGSAAPSFRALVSADIPSLDAAKIGSGTFAVARLGSGATSSNFLRGDSTFANPLAVGNTIGSSPATGSALFVGAAGVLQQDNANFFFDDTNNRLGLGVNTSLGAKVHAKCASAGEPAFIAQYAASPTIAPFQVKDSAGAIESEWRTKGETNQFLGKTAGNMGMTGTMNHGHGFSVLNSVTSGANNAALGGYSGTNITTGSDNVAIGYLAAFSLSTGSNNVSLGSNAGRSNSIANNNLAIGTAALYNATAGSNVGIGVQAGYGNTSGTNNVYIGENAGFSNQTGNYNTLIGVDAGRGILGSGNVCIGLQAGYSETGSNMLWIANAAGGYLIKGNFSTKEVWTDGKHYVADEAYHATNWNGNLSVPTKNAIRDKIEAIKAAFSSISPLGDSTTGTISLVGDLVDTGNGLTNNNFATMNAKIIEVLDLIDAVIAT